MISVKLSEEKFWYDIYNIIKMFFNNDKIVLLKQSSDNSGIYADFCVKPDYLCSRLSNTGNLDYIANRLSNTGNLDDLANNNIKSNNTKNYITENNNTENNNAESNNIEGNNTESTGISFYIEIEKDGNKIVDLSVSRDNYSCYNHLTDIKKELARQVYIALSGYTGKKLPWGMLTGVRPAKIPYEMMEKGMATEGILSELQNYYFVSPKKASLAYKVAETEREILKRNTKDMISLYIGIPFCKTRCYYCSFTSNCIDKNAHLIDKYIDTLKKEIQITNEDIIKKEKLKIQAIYIGGGTPTSVSDEILSDLLYFIENTLDLHYLEEYTIEAGRPDTIDREKLVTIKNSKVSRISINPQTMNPETLKAIGRNHTPEELKEAFYLAREIGFDNINMDIIVGLPGEDLSMFEHTLKEIRKMNPENLTVHSLSIKRASKLKEDLDILNNYKDNKGIMGNRYSRDKKGSKDYVGILKNKYLSTDETANAMADMAYNYALSMGMHPYYLYRQKNIAGNLENVGYSKPGFEGIYNIQIMEERQTIVAFGAGAVTKVLYPEENRLERAFNVKNLEDYITRIDEMVERKKKLWE
jgi:coproporphyrinogen dehydrogenase HemZ